jgi:hypothetical protein
MLWPVMMDILDDDDRTKGRSWMRYTHFYGGPFNGAINFHLLFCMHMFGVLRDDKFDFWSTGRFVVLRWRTDTSERRMVLGFACI